MSWDVADGGPLFSTDLDILAAGVQGTGVVSGGAVTAQGSPDMTVAFAAASEQFNFNPVPVAVAGGNVTIATAHASLDRYDLIVANSSGVKSAVAGTAQVGPRPPAIPANSVVHALVSVPAGDTTIGPAQIFDRRVTVIPFPNPSAFTDNVKKSADESVTSSATLQDDNELVFPIAANETKFFELFLRIEAASATPDFKSAFSITSGTITGYRSPAVWAPISTSATGTVLEDLTIASSEGTSVGIVLRHIVGWAVCGATPGFVRFRWAQDTSNASPVTVKKGSVLRTSAA